MPIFHYALRPRGFLVLGRSEGANESPELFLSGLLQGPGFRQKPKALDTRAYPSLNE